MAQQILTNGSVVTYSSETGDIIASTGLVLDQGGLSEPVPSTLLEVPSVSGLYLISFSYRITSPASGTGPTAFSTLGPVIVDYTCADSLTSASVIAALNLANGSVSATDTGNAASSGWSGSVVICALAGQPINITIGYSSSGAGASKMVYSYHVKAVFLGGLPG